MASFFGFDKQECSDLVKEVEDFSDLGHYLDLPVRVYSSGMRLRLTFSIITSVVPQILLIDEGIGAGDSRFQSKVKNRVDNMIRKTSILLIASHDESIIRDMCTHCLLLDQGKVINFSGVDEGLKLYKEINDKFFSSPKRKVFLKKSIKFSESLINKPPRHFIPDKNLSKDIGWRKYISTDFFKSQDFNNKKFTNDNYPDTWNETLFLMKHPYVLEFINTGQYSSGWDYLKKNINVISDHHRFFNNLSEKIPYQWDESSYLKINETIPSLISKDFYRSGWEHFKKKRTSGWYFC